MGGPMGAPPVIYDRQEYRNKGHTILLCNTLPDSVMSFLCNEVVQILNMACHQSRHVTNLVFSLSWSFEGLPCMHICRVQPSANRSYIQMCMLLHALTCYGYLYTQNCCRTFIAKKHLLWEHTCMSASWAAASLSRRFCTLRFSCLAACTASLAEKWLGFGGQQFPVAARSWLMRWVTQVFLAYSQLTARLLHWQIM